MAAAGIKLILGQKKINKIIIIVVIYLYEWKPSLPGEIVFFIFIIIIINIIVIKRATRSKSLFPFLHFTISRPHVDVN